MKSNTPVVLIVDDVLENLAYLHDALDESGYQVLIASSGAQAIERAVQMQPSIILLDAMMPEMDGFDTCRKLKQDPVVSHIPIIFMTGLTDSEHVAKGFEVGGIDYVTKPVRPREVLARIASHLQTAKLMSQARSALDAFGQATIAISPISKEIIWLTPLARQLICEYFSVEETLHFKQLPGNVFNWLIFMLREIQNKEEAYKPLSVIKSSKRLIFDVGNITSDEWVLILREESDAVKIEVLITTFKLTRREAEVLYWVVKGKTNKDIGDILNTSPRTVNKHLEHIFTKLGVETRTAAASIISSRLRIVI